MGRKKSRAKYTSKGERRNVASGRPIRSERGAYEVWLAKRTAWKNGRNVILERGVDNSGNKYKVTAKQAWGDPHNDRYKQ